MSFGIVGADSEEGISRVRKYRQEGQGLSHYDLPLVSRINSIEYPYPIKEGMVFALETQHGKMFDFGVKIEEVLVVTENGHEVITKFPLEEITTVH